MTFTKEQKRFLSKMFNQGIHEDPKPLWAADRIICDNGDEGLDARLLAFGFCEFEDWMTDEDIDMWFDEHMRIRIPSHMGWDCTGMPFTNWIDWHRNPNGWVSFVHCIEHDY